nr:MAG TPA: hypothetical protein [Caudoviricetes sp.]
MGNFSSAIYEGHQFLISLTTHLLSLLTLSIISDFLKMSILFSKKF